MPIIVLTAAAADLAQHRAIELGAAALFQKPADKNELFACIEGLLGGAESQDLHAVC
jgi:DNA-binding response OmpR family regulator